MPIPIYADLPPQHQQTPIAEVRAAEQNPDQELVKKAIQAVAQPFVDAFNPLGDLAQKKAKSLIDGARNTISPPLNEQERKAAQTMRDMLEPNRLGGEDRTLNHRDLDAIYKGAGGGLKGIATRAVLRSTLPKSLAEAGVVEDPDAKADSTPRRFSRTMLQNFGRASKVLDQRKEKLAKWGLKVQFPEGISQAAIDHLLEGRFGLPPGAKLQFQSPLPQE